MTVGIGRATTPTASPTPSSRSAAVDFKACPKSTGPGLQYETRAFFNARTQFFDTGKMRVVDGNKQTEREIEALDKGNREPGHKRQVRRQHKERPPALEYFAPFTDLHNSLIS